MPDSIDQSHPMTDWLVSFANLADNIQKSRNRIPMADIMLGKILEELRRDHGLGIEVSFHSAKKATSVSDWNFNLTGTREQLNEANTILGRVLEEIQSKIEVEVEVTVRGDIIPPEYT